ncbi:hypothetical protein CRUP_017419 [Coryphaenoides rupestris]|nr:hypothetical protein CRUP_017419 [Coryphaenoides rupestris]
MSDRGDVDLTGAQQNTGVWLVKVPKYLSLQWAKAAGRGEVGKLRISKNQGKAEVAFTLNEDLTAIEASGDKKLHAPRDHPFSMQTVGGQMLAVFTETPAGQSEERSIGSSSGGTCPDKVALEGVVTYLKEILRDIGNYNVKGTHKNTWELKPEYRHYQAEEKMEEERI